jgi:hypothetical protein
MAWLHSALLLLHETGTTDAPLIPLRTAASRSRLRGELASRLFERIVLKARGEHKEVEAGLYAAERPSCGRRQRP